VRKNSLGALLVCLWSLGTALPLFAEDQQKTVSAPIGALTSEGSYYVTWTSIPDPVPLNEMFEMHFKVARADDHQVPVPAAMITLSAWMPVHNHGTSLQPVVESIGDGTAIAKGVLLHMPGAWELRVGIAVSGQMERATFEIQLEP
jgi:hypothetical protein